MSARGDLCENEEVGIDGDQGSSPIEQVEELVAIEDIHAWLLGCLPSLELQSVDRSSALSTEPLAQQVVHQALQRHALPSGKFLEPPQEIRVDLQSRPRHTSKCIVKAS